MTGVQTGALPIWDTGGSAGGYRGTTGGLLEAQVAGIGGTTGGILEAQLAGIGGTTGGILEAQLAGIGRRLEGYWRLSWRV